MSKPVNICGSNSKLHHFINKPLGVITTKTEIGGLSKKELTERDNNKSLELTLLLNFILYSDGVLIHTIHTLRKHKMTNQEFLDKKSFIEIFKTQHSELINIVKNDDETKLAFGFDVTTVTDHQKLEDQCLQQLEKLDSDFHN